MTTGGGRQRAIRDTVVAACAAAAVLALGLVGARQSHELDRERRGRADQEVVGALAAGLTLDLELARAALVEASRDAASTPPILTPRDAVPGARWVELVEPGDGGAPDLPPLIEDVADLAAVFDRARDIAQPVLSDPVDVGGDLRAYLVAAAYQRDLRGRPESTVDRRARLLRWVVTEIGLVDLVGARIPEGAVAEVRVGRLAASVRGEAVPERLPQQTVDVGGHHFLLRAGDPGPVGVGGATVGLAAASAVLAAGFGATVAGARTRHRANRALVKRQAAQVRLVGEVAPIVQHSLELSDVLPAVAVQLMDHFGLAGVSMSAGGSGPGAVELFRIGAPADPDAKPVLRPPDSLDAGETLALALQRGGRSVALLQVVAGRSLDRLELQSLRALTELVTAAVVNASLYASQQDALHRLRELDALKTVFLSTASHELRTPATAIGGFASLLTTGWDRFSDEERRDFAQRIAANARSLGAVVQDLLDISILDRGALSVAIEAVDLGAAVADVVARLGPIFDGHHIEVVTTPAPPVAADPNAIDRIVSNLLSNAAKYAPAGTTVTMRVAPARGPFGAELVVSDEGPGVPPEERAHVFTRFYRGSGQATLQTRGVGIGLSVVAELVARMHGEVVLDDAPGGGARFTVRLPVSTPDPHDEEADRVAST